MKNIHIVYPESIGEISPEIYGHFSEHIGGVFYGGLWVGRDSDIPNVSGFRTDAIEALKKIKPAVLRWPGGCFAETYNWRDGIGENRPVRLNWWTNSDGRYESNEVGTHEFFELCRLIGAKAYLAVNVTGMTPLDIREWFDYCLSPEGTTALAAERVKNGHPEPFDIPYIGIGNENWGEGGNMTPDYYALEYRKYSTLIKHVAPDAKFIAGGADGGAYSWTHDLAQNLSQSRSRVDGMSLHYYSGATGDAVNFTDSEWYGMIEKASRMQELIDRHSAITKGFGMENKMKLVVDEWGCWHPGGSGPSKGYNLFEQQSTMRDAIVAAMTLNIFNNSCDKVIMSNVAQVCNNLHCLLLAGKDGLILTPTYHIFDMYKEHQGGRAMRAFVDGDESPDRKISVSASEKDGFMTVTVANPILEDVEIKLDLLGANLPESAKATLLCAERIRDINTFDEPSKVVPKEIAIDPRKTITLPAASVLLISLQRGI